MGYSFRNRFPFPKYIGAVMSKQRIDSYFFLILHMLMQILFSCGHPPADMTFRFIDIQNHPGFRRQCWVDL